jgi:hypothetical protein
MKIKLISLIALSLGVCAVAFATDYKAPEFNEDYKVEGAVKTDRQIASEKESDREPSSVVATEKKKKVEDDKEEKSDPQPWLFQKGKGATDY